VARIGIVAVVALIAACGGSGGGSNPPPAADTTAPSVPTGVVGAAASSTQVNVTWTAATDNVGVTGYQVERCQGAGCTTFTRIGTPTANSYSDTGLTASTAYTYRVRATDAAGNLSGYSSNASATTQSATPPPSGTIFYIRDGGTSTACSDWTNACDTLPATLQRGATYYIADGVYGSYTFDDPVSNTSYITIKKATATDHGTDAGWSSTYGDGQAAWSGWQIYTDYYSFDGQMRNADWRAGGINQYGISTGNTRLDNGSGIGGDNLTFKYIDFHGGGRDTGLGDDVIYGLTGNSNITFQYCALHDSDRTIFLMRGNWQNLVVDHSYLARNASSPAIHGEILSTTDSNNITFSHNVIEDPEGTAVWAFINGGLATNWKIFGNTIFHSSSYSREGISGVIFCANDASNNNTCNNFSIYNNTIWGIRGLYSGFVVQAGTGHIVQNNIWYNSVRTNNSFSGTISHNWYYNTTQDGDSSSTKIVCTSNCNIFVNDTGKNFDLSTPTVSGATLVSPYNIDPDGITRGADGTWDRGAHEF
jgi:hypothetical protein